jgi:hypothetical protein
MPSLPAAFLLLGALGLAAALAWGFFRSPAKRRPAPRRKRKATRADQVPAAPKGSSDLERLAWIVGKMTATPPRRVATDVPLAELLAKAKPAEFATAVAEACGAPVTADEATLRMNLKQFAQFLRTLRRADAKPMGRKRSPKVAGDRMADWEPPQLALAAELGVKPEWEIEKALAHLTKEYLRQNARIHLAARAADRDAVQARLEQIGRLRDALRPAGA